MNLVPAPDVTLTDADVAEALGRAVRIIGPLLDLLWGTDPLGLKTRTPGGDADPGPVDRLADGLGWVLNVADVPGTDAWEEMDADARISWWVWRVGAVNNVAVAFPGVLGVVARQLPVQDLLGFVNQAIVLCAVARELGVTDHRTQVELLAAVLCGRTLTDISGADDVEADVVQHNSCAPVAVGKTIWKLVGVLNAVGEEVARRPHPRAPFRYLGMLPAVGAVAGYFGELGALSRAARQGRKWIAAHPRVSA